MMTVVILRSQVLLQHRKNEDLWEEGSGGGRAMCIRQEGRKEERYGRQ